MREYMVAASLLILPAPAFAAGLPDSAAGKKVAEIECAGCHAITLKAGKAPPERVQGAAPTFATVARDPAMTAEKIRQFLKLPHGSMNNVLLTEKDTNDLISFILGQKSTASP